MIRIDDVTSIKRRLAFAHESRKSLLIIVFITLLTLAALVTLVCGYLLEPPDGVHIERVRADRCMWILVDVQWKSVDVI